MPSKSRKSTEDEVCHEKTGRSRSRAGERQEVKRLRRLLGELARPGDVLGRLPLHHLDLYRLAPGEDDRMALFRVTSGSTPSGDDADLLL